MAAPIAGVIRALFDQKNYSSTTTPTTPSTPAAPPPKWTFQPNQFDQAPSYNFGNAQQWMNVPQMQEWMQRPTQPGMPPMAPWQPPALDANWGQAPPPPPAPVTPLPPAPPNAVPGLPTVPPNTGGGSPAPPKQNGSQWGQDLQNKWNKRIDKWGARFDRKEAKRKDSPQWTRERAKYGTHFDRQLQHLKSKYEGDPGFDAQGLISRWNTFYN